MTFKNKYKKIPKENVERIKTDVENLFAQNYNPLLIAKRVVMNTDLQEHCRCNQALKEEITECLLLFSNNKFGRTNNVKQNEDNMKAIASGNGLVKSRYIITVAPVGFIQIYYYLKKSKIKEIVIDYLDIYKI